MKIYILCAGSVLSRIDMRVGIMNFHIPLVVASEKGAV